MLLLTENLSLDSSLQHCVVTPDVIRKRAHAKNIRAGIIWNDSYR